jgi:hypothetical protein
MSLFMRAVFWFVAANALIGALLLMFFPTRTDTLFFWEIRPPINAALFGALYLGGAAVVAWVSYRGLWEPARFLIPVLVAAGFFISLTTLMHLDRFAPGLKLIYWLVIYVGAPLLALYFYIDQERRGADWTVIEPVTPATRRIAVVIGIIILALGILLLIAPDLVVSSWPWMVSPLMIRIFASWFSAFGVGFLWFLRERDWRRLQHVANLTIAASALDLLMVFLHRNDLNSAGLNLWVYCFHLLVFGLAGIVMHLLQRRARLNR